MNSIVNLDLDFELNKFFWFTKIKNKIKECRAKLNSKDAKTRIDSIKELIKFLILLTETKQEGSIQSFEMSQFDEELNLIKLSIQLLDEHSPSSDQQTFDEIWIKQTIYNLELIQGLCLIVPKQTLLSLAQLKQNYLRLILIYFKINLSNLKICCLETFQCILILNHSFIRNFEQLGGVEEIVHLLKLQSTFREVRLKCVEFLYQYILPETNICRKSTKLKFNEAILSSEDKMNYIASELGMDFVKNLLIPLNSNQ